jgi:hypothetical protein
VFQDGHLSGLLGFERLEGIDPTIPLVMFAVVFGLSMDYEVFLLSRIREEWLRSGDNQGSVIFGLAHTGRIITSAAMILLVVIGAFAAGQLVYAQHPPPCSSSATGTGGCRAGCTCRWSGGRRERRRPGEAPPRSPADDATLTPSRGRR